MSDSPLPLENCNPCTDCPPVPALLQPCPGSEPCDELSKVGCLTYAGDAIVEGAINPGERLDETIQKILVGMVSGVNCISPTLNCVTKLHSTAIAVDSFTIKWNAATTITAATLQYKAATADTWTTTPVTGLTTKQITGLLAGTKYFVKITTAASGNVNCSSVTLAITTKAS